MDQRYHSTAFSSATNPVQQQYQQQQQQQQQQPPNQRQPQPYQQYDFSSMQANSIAPLDPSNRQQYNTPARSSPEKSTLPPLQQSSIDGQATLPSLYHQSSTQNMAPQHSLTSAMPDGHSSQHFLQPQSTTSGSMLPPTSTYMPMGLSYPMAQQAGPHSAAEPNYQPNVQNRLSEFRTMQNDSNHSSANNSPLTPFPPFASVGVQHQYIPTPQDQASGPTHVVGSQGRRGILPSEPGRAAPPAAGAAAASKSMIPVKDADGKFPCPHCNKTYLHAKHLKRHLLRHTGDRPYMCFLCKDTFSRSDILKRHFQKCSIRRGNPTGASHLAHQRRNTNPSNRLSLSGASDALGLAGLPEINGTAFPGKGNTTDTSPTVNGDLSSYASSIASLSNRSSRANSLIHPAGARMAADGRHLVNTIGLSPLHQGTTNDPSGQHAVTSYNNNNNTNNNNNVPAYMRAHSQSNPSAHGYGYAPINHSGQSRDGVKQEPNGSVYSTSGTETPSTRGSSGSGLDWNAIFSPTEPSENQAPQTNGQSQLPIKTQQHMTPQHYHPTNGHSDVLMNRLYATPSGYNENQGHHPSLPMVSN